MRIICYLFYVFKMFNFLRFLYILFLYKWIYKKYYEWMVLIGLIVVYVYFVEMLLFNLILFLCGLLIFGSNFVIILWWFVIVFSVIIIYYSGYYLLLLLLLEFYDFYYLK